MFETLYDDLKIQSQYSNTNIAELLNGIKEIRKKFILRALESAVNEVFNLQTASGDALDMWGRLLNFSRFVLIAKETGNESFKNLNFYERNFFLAKFFDEADKQFVELRDYSYRELLQMLWWSRNSLATLRDSSELARLVFKADIITGDSQNMEYITYFFKNEIPQWLNNILTNYDVLPRPAGVGSRFVSAYYKIFGFQTDNFDYNREKLTNFFNAQFVREDIGEINYFTSGRFADNEHIEFNTLIQELKDELGYHLSDNSTFFNNHFVENPPSPPFEITP